MSSPRTSRRAWAKPEQLTDAPQALVVVPTRELCQQVTNDLLTAGKVRAVRVLSIYGGRAYEPQVEALKKGVDVIVGTPGRLLDLAGQKKLRLSSVKALVLDEADEMLDLGFLPDVEKIIQLLPARRQTMLFSATMPGQVISLARRYMSQPTHIRATAPDDEGATVANITQHVFRAHSLDKPEVGPCRCSQNPSRRARRRSDCPRREYWSSPSASTSRSWSTEPGRYGWPGRSSWSASLPRSQPLGRDLRADETDGLAGGPGGGRLVGGRGSAPGRRTA
ncbi:DEAD-box ATP-dependent RNA helicase CshA [Streptomyces antimycoticus]